jgi:hypothetical protein
MDVLTASPGQALPRPIVVMSGHRVTPVCMHQMQLIQILSLEGVTDTRLRNKLFRGAAEVQLTETRPMSTEAVRCGKKLWPLQQAVTGGDVDYGSPAPL